MLRIIVMYPRNRTVLRAQWSVFPRPVLTYAVLQKHADDAGPAALGGQVERRVEPQPPAPWSAPAASNRSVMAAWFPWAWFSRGSYKYPLVRPRLGGVLSEGVETRENKYSYRYFHTNWLAKYCSVAWAATLGEGASDLVLLFRARINEIHNPKARTERTHATDMHALLHWGHNIQLPVARSRTERDTRPKRAVPQRAIWAGRVSSGRGWGNRSSGGSKQQPTGLGGPPRSASPEAAGAYGAG